MPTKKGLEKFGEKSAEAIINEYQQLCDKKVFIPRSFSSLTYEQRRNALRSITLVENNQNGDVKVRTVADVSVQKVWMDVCASASPTVSTEGLFITRVIETLERRNMAISANSGVFL
uniref:Uncharacterized protein n=1 Tax=Eucampia antarctica TaxID=49252 RepID=A0A7S2R645_9STRA|mmetsp:Transcript_17530/g.16993  ORF Transcript_17530/g.16993 Transcript_17530/m.16993 type:complete len:117 (+) Transcript_17530:3-353(+)